MEWLIIMVIWALTGAMCFNIGFKRGADKGVGVAVDLTITHTIHKLKEAACKVDKEDEFREILEQAFDMAKIDEAQKRLERIRKISRRFFIRKTEE